MNPETGHVSKNRRTIPAFVIGAMVGFLVWCLSLIGASTLDQMESSFPNWMQAIDLGDTVGSICKVIAWPIAVVGWLLVWGDNGPPYAWLESLALNAAAGIGMAAFVGAVVAQVVSVLFRGRRDRTPV